MSFNSEWKPMGAKRVGIRIMTSRRDEWKKVRARINARATLISKHIVEWSPYIPVHHVQDALGSLYSSPKFEVLISTGGARSIVF